MAYNRRWRAYPTFTAPVIDPALIPPPPAAPPFFGVADIPNPRAMMPPPRCVALREEVVEVVGIEAVGAGPRVVMDQWYRPADEPLPGRRLRGAEAVTLAFLPNPGDFPVYVPARLEWNVASPDPQRRKRSVAATELVRDPKPVVPQPVLSTDWMILPPEITRPRRRAPGLGGIEAARPVIDFTPAPVSTTWFMPTGEPPRGARPRQPGFWCGVLEPTLFVAPPALSWFFPPPEAVPRRAEPVADFSGFFFGASPGDFLDPYTICPPLPDRPDEGAGRQEARPDETSSARRRPDDNAADRRGRPGVEDGPRARPDEDAGRRKRPDDCGGPCPC